MSIAIVADAACDLPKEFIASRQLTILPIHLRFGNQIADDTRDPNLAMKFYRTYIDHKDIHAETTPYSPQETAALFRRLLAHHEHVLAVTISRTRSKIYDNALEATKLLKLTGEDPRVRVIDSNSFFSGEAAVVAGAVEQVENGATFEQVADNVQALTANVQTYAVPRDPYYLWSRARKRGDRSVSWLQYMAGKALDIKPVVYGRGPQTQSVEKVRRFDAAMAILFERAIEAMKRGLRVPVLPMAYAGNPKEITTFPKFRELETTARSLGVQLLFSVMSPTGGIYLGPGAFGFGFLPERAD